MGSTRVMRGVLLMVFEVKFVFSVYLTMTEVEFKIPNVIENSQPRDYPLIEFEGRNSYGRTEMKYSLNITGEYMQINSSSGAVLLTSRFFRDIKGIGKISSTTYVEDVNSGDRDKTILQVNVFPLDALDCDKFVEEICFWTRATYRVEKRSGATLMGPLSSPYLLEICPYRINYTLGPDENFKLIPPDKKHPWSIGSIRPLVKIKKDSLTLHITCTLENSKGTEKGAIRKIDRDISIILLDLDAFPPEPQSPEIDIKMTQRTFEKGYIVHHPHLIFVDNDTVEANHFDALIVGGDNRNLLKPFCKKHPFPQDGDEIRTAIHCTLEFKEDMSFNTSQYSFILQLNDTTLKNSKAKSAVQLPIHFVFMDPPQSLTMPKLYPRSTVKIFRTAAPLARITQPLDIRNCSDFEMVELTKKGDGLLFNITKEEGIIFVHDYLKLRKSASEYISLNVSWIKQNRKEYDEIQVRIVNEPNKTCGNIKSFNGWVSCAEYETSADCLQKDSCAISTGGSSSLELRRGPERCMWRGDETSPNITHLYSTCTPDIKTCPDGFCDSLEMLNDLICPQDCATQAVVPLKINSKTGRGVDVASGTVVCSAISCYSIKSKKGSTNEKKEAKKKKQKHLFNTASQSNYTVIHSNFTGKSDNITAGKFMIDIGKCGTLCITGIGLGTLFLVGAIISFVVICYRLDKTNKVVRKKIDLDNQEMRAPLSISAPGNAPNELSFSFNLTPPVENTSFITNIINKYKPDPKWEFPRSQLVIMQTLGEGEFGRVLRAKALNISGLTGYTTVAVKTLKDDARESELNDLLSEYQLLKEVSHPNVIRLLGVCTEAGGPIYLIIEYAEHGSLRNYLRRSRKLQYDSNKRNTSQKENDDLNYDEPKTSDITPKNLLSFAWQICNGMAYLSDMKLVHRDLAARNVLLAADKVCKISDFGLTRDVYEDNAYLKRSKGRVPVKWMAPESLADHIYTSKSDVWSFGVLVWELVTLGATPYPGIAVQNLYHLLRQGYRMERPNNCSPGLYKIMRRCWHIDPDERPTFHELVKCWEKLLEDKMEYVNLSDSAIHNRGYFLSPFEEEENPADDSSSDISPLNYLSRTQSYEKCGATEKSLDAEVQNIIAAQNISQGYETPVKIPRKIKTPSNENPEEYTDMCGKS